MLYIEDWFSQSVMSPTNLVAYALGLTDFGGSFKTLAWPRDGPLLAWWEVGGASAAVMVMRRL